MALRKSWSMAGNWICSPEGPRSDRLRVRLAGGAGGGGDGAGDGVDCGGCGGVGARSILLKSPSVTEGL